DTLRALEDFLDDWPGALVVVSHDRAFLERTVADVIVLDGTGRCGRRPGGYSAWEAERRAVAPAGGRKAASVTEAAPVEGGAKGARPGKARAGGSHAPLRALLKEAEKDLARLEKAKARLDEEVTTAAEAADHEALRRLGAELGEVQEALRSAEERWLEVSE